MFGKVKDRTSMAEVLRGTRAGRIQSVGYMQVIPLISNLTDDRFVSPTEGQARVSTTGYGTLDFDNPSEAVLIVPCHAGYVVKQAAQDHAMSHAGLVAGGKRRAFNTAVCIQQNQGGLIRHGNYRMLILPFPLREPALKLRKKREYNRLWHAIGAFNRTLGVPAWGHLEYFLNRFRKELDQFVAEFECVPKQLGAIILVDGRVVGIERAPNHDYWRSVWPCLIRECYGSLAIQVARSRGETSPPPSTRVPLAETTDSLDELADAVADAAAEEERRAETIVRELLMEPFATEVDDHVAGLTLETLSHARFAGQVVRDGERVVYASILAKRRRLLEQEWERAAAFSI
ncbi:MAG: hypothetical protein JSV78_11250 [Phycisphaerales bacterium]|nr:MAG: hypothetical protein JSV78_11250 [Phycisphaerales bacterium]